MDQPFSPIPNLQTHAIVEYTYIDNLYCLRPLRESVLAAALPIMNVHYEKDIPEESKKAFKRDTRKNERAVRAALSTLFTDAGWAGDGKINCIFVAPCLIPVETFHGSVIYHVKQNENGISWLAVPRDLRLAVPEQSGISGWAAAQPKEVRATAVHENAVGHQFRPPPVGLPPLPAAPW